MSGDVKKYYIKERYDWTDTANSIKGFESIYHKLREIDTRKLIKKYVGNGSTLDAPILDAGCGTGLILRNLPTNSIAIDINLWALKKAKKYAPSADVVLADIEHLPFKNNTFSLIVCTQILEHLNNPKNIIKNISNILKDDGIFIGSVPNDTILWRLRFLSRSPKGEPFHDDYNKDDVKELIQPFFDILLLEIPYYMLNIFFAAKKKKA